MDLSAYMTAAGILCFIAYLTASLSHVPLIAFAGCMISGMAVGIMWPGSISLTSAKIPKGRYGTICITCSGWRCGWDTWTFAGGTWHSIQRERHPKRFACRISLSSYFGYLSALD